MWEEEGGREKGRRDVSCNALGGLVMIPVQREGGEEEEREGKEEEEREGEERGEEEKVEGRDEEGEEEEEEGRRERKREEREEFEWKRVCNAFLLSFLLSYPL